MSEEKKETDCRKYFEMWYKEQFPNVLAAFDNMKEKWYICWLTAWQTADTINLAKIKGVNHG